MQPHFHPGRLVMVDIPGTRLDADTAAFLREHHIRAVCLFRKNLRHRGRGAAADAPTCARSMGAHALIGMDQEGGSVVRATFLPQAPAAMALGAVGDSGAGRGGGRSGGARRGAAWASTGTSRRCST